MRYSFLAALSLICFLTWAPLPAAAQASADHPVALVERVEEAPRARVEFMDYVYPGQQIDLGRRGRLTLAYLDSCRVEKITGGMVAVAASRKDGGSLVERGRMLVNSTECAAQHARLAANASEAGATVNRLSKLFGNHGWREKTVASPTPLFKWARQEARAMVEVLDLDRKTPKVIWQAKSRRSYIRYPKTAPDLKTGRPYELRVSLANGEMLRGVFSIDPQLETPRTLSANVITAVR